MPPIAYTAVVWNATGIPAYTAASTLLPIEKAYRPRRVCREGQANFLRRADMPVLLFLKETGVHVGNSGLHRFDWSVPRCELGFWLRTSYGGRGLMTEAANELTAFAFRELGMRRVEALTDEENARARRVCERAGFVLEGILRHYRASPQGGLRNACVYALVR